MASKKAGRLAGLAALAGLAYMANKKGEGDKDTAAANNRIADARAAREEEKGPALKPSDAAKKEDAVDTGDFMSRRLNRVDTDDGKAYSTNNLSPMSSPVKAPATKTPAVRFETVGRTQKELDDTGKTMIDKQNKEAAQAKLMSSYKPRRPDVKLRDVDYQYPATGESGTFTNKQLKRFGAEERSESEEQELFGKKRGGVVKKMASGGMTSSASKRGDGIAQRGKTKGRVC